MKKFALCVLVLGVVVGVSSMAVAGNTANQTVTYEVQAINEISVSGNPAALIISSATAGSQPTAATNALTTWAITTNESAKKLTGVLNTAMPANVTLTAELAAPTGGVSAGAVTLTNVAASLVTSIETVAESGKSITYTLSATVAAGVVASASKTVTLTLTAE